MAQQIFLLVDGEWLEGCYGPEEFNGWADLEEFAGQVVAADGPNA